MADLGDTPVPADTPIYDCTGAWRIRIGDRVIIRRGAFAGCTAWVSEVKWVRVRGKMQPRVRVGWVRGGRVLKTTKIHRWCSPRSLEAQ